jgi:phospholipid/cholesterol/gamma-HCH transport system substrate-binding protein
LSSGKEQAMNTRSTDVKVGITVIAAAVILILGVAWIGQFRMSRHYEAYTVYFTDVGGLNPGDPVTIAGLEMGKVGPMAFEADRVKTELLLQQGVTLKQDCSVEIRSIGLMGEKFIYIVPGKTAAVIPPGAVIQGQYKAGLTEMTIVMEEVMNEIKGLSQAVRKILATEEDTHTVSQTLARVNELTDELLALIRDNKEDLRSTARSLRQASDNVNDILGGRKQEIIDGIDGLARASASLDSLSQALRSVMASLERGEGTLGMLIKEKDIHDELQATIKNLDALIKDVKEHPERYMKVEIF